MMLVTGALLAFIFSSVPVSCSHEVLTVTWNVDGDGHKGMQMQKKQNLNG